jgi:hypothetical protein
MRAITLWRPWPWAMFHAGKPVENRTWPLPQSLVGKTIALHAGKRMDNDVLRRMRAGAFGERARRIPVVGHPVGVVGLVTFGMPYEVSNYYGTVDQWIFGPWAWPVVRIVELASPVACRGAQGLWTLPDDVEKDVREQAGVDF